MSANPRLKIAIQKSGRLNQDSLELLSQCGLKIRNKNNALFCMVENLPIDILFVRDDDIPMLVTDRICDLGIVGENVLLEKNVSEWECIKKLGFGRCRLSIAFPKEKNYADLKSLENLRIATSYPNLLKSFLLKHGLESEIVPFSGSVEITTRLGIADVICDLVSTGRTLEENHLKEVATIIESQAILIKTQNPIDAGKIEMYELLMRRIEGVLRAQESKYIMFHVATDMVDRIKNILPGCETPTILPLEGFTNKVAVHLVSSEGVFWTTLEKLKSMGATSILVLPIEKMLS